jgi:hypothetical protein
MNRSSAGEARDEPGDVRPALHGQRRQLERGDPSLGAPLQRCDVLRRQGQPHHLVEVRRRLVRGETQVGGTDLDELAATAQPRHREGRVGAAGDHQAQLHGQVLQQEGHLRVHVGRVDHVVVVEHEHDVVGQGGQVIQQGGEDRVDGRLRRLQQRQRTRADPGHRLVQRGHEVGPEHCGVVVALVQGEPRRGASVGG